MPYLIPLSMIIMTVTLTVCSGLRSRAYLVTLSLLSVTLWEMILPNPLRELSCRRLFDSKNRENITYLSTTAVRLSSEPLHHKTMLLSMCRTMLFHPLSRQPRYTNTRYNFYRIAVLTHTVTGFSQRVYHTVTQLTIVCCSAVNKTKTKRRGKSSLQVQQQEFTVRERESNTPSSKTNKNKINHNVKEEKRIGFQFTGRVGMIPLSTI